jgi:hypothetical protein
MALKAHGLNLPMTFAIRDINLDLRAHVEFARGEIRIRPAAANEPQASVFHVVFSAITRPMIQETATALADDPGDRPIEELGEELSDEERRKLEWVGVRTIGQLQKAERQGVSREIGRVTNLPVERLRQALERATAPMVREVMPVTPAPGDALRRLLRVRGRNLAPEGAVPRVTVAGRPVPVVGSAADELLVAPDDGQWAGQIRVESPDGYAGAMSFDLSAFAPPGPAPVTRGTAQGSNGAAAEDGR